VSEKKKRILIADDVTMTRNLLSQVVGKLGFDYDEAENGQIALDKILNGESDYDLLIIDLEMPVMGGIGLMDRLIENDISTPLIVLTGHSGIELAKDAIQRGASEFLLKDENIQETVEVLIEQVIEKHKIQEEQKKAHQEELQRLFDIGIALSAENNLDKLLEMIVDEARRFTNADAGTLYTLEEGKLHFKILQNESLNTRMGGTSGNKITFPPVALKKENVSAYAGLTKETVNIPDVYEAEGFDFTGPKKFDEATGYRSKSMLVVPMLDQDNEVIGVLQLINCQHIRTGNSIAFSQDFVALTQSMASQAAVAIVTARLIEGMQVLFDSFVKVMATAIDERSPYTGGHIKRVAELGVLMCEAINEATEGPYADVSFSDDELKEMSVAGWMHDIGKVTTPVHIMDKATKLETIVDRIDYVEQRLLLAITVKEKEWLEKKIELIEANAPADEIAKGEKELSVKVAEIKEGIALLIASNKGGEFMDPEKQEKIKILGERTFISGGKEVRFLTDDEIVNLCIPKGTLLETERKLMQDHIVVTIKMLEQIPFTKHLANIPKYAGGHHECLNGSGYPKGLKGDELSLGARILNLVDFYEALTAKDRPYKIPMPLEKALKILGFEVKDGKIDNKLFDLFVSSDIPGRYDKFIEKQEREKAVTALNFD